MTEQESSRRILLPAALAWSTLVLIFVEWSVRSGVPLQPFLELADLRVGPAAFGALPAHAILCRSDRRKTLVLRIGVVLEVVRFVLLLRAGVGIEVLSFSVGYGFFAAALVDFVYHREWRSAAIIALVPIGMASAPLGLAGVVRRMTPTTFDGALYALDAALRIPFSRLAGEFFDAAPAIRILSFISYAALPGSIVAGLAYEEYNYRRNVERGVGVNVLLAYAVSGSLAAAFYIMCPGTGPYHAFPNAFPSHLPDPASVPLALAPFAPLSPRNAMPSLHAAWAVLLARSTAGSRLALRIVAWSLALFTILATIGSGEHYVIDLVAAAPFLVALEAATAHRYVSFRTRMIPLITGILFFGAWIFAVRHAASIIPIVNANPAAYWIFTVATLGVSALVALRPVKKGPEPATLKV